MDFTPPFGAWLKARRKQLDLTQAALAQRAHYSTIAIQKAEAGAQPVSRALAAALAPALDVPETDRPAFLAFARGLEVRQPLNHLPLPATPMLGRAADLATLAALLAPAASERLVTLLGPPGVGKTRLALQLARELQPAFADGAVFVPLAQLSDPAHIPIAILNAIRQRAPSGAPGAGTMSPVEAIIEFLESRELLLIHDNFEHLLAGAALIADLLARCPRLRVLVTSRERLNLSGERVVELRPLARPDAITLFARQAAAIKPGFARTPQNESLLDEICAHLDDLPLAIELAAARVRMLTPGRLLARLTDHHGSRFELLNTGPRDADPRQRALSSTIDWSYRLLSEAEQRFFRRMSVFAGGCDLDGAAAICLDPVDRASPELAAAESALQSLLDKCLIQETEGPNSSPRFSLLESLREYARLRLVESAESDLAHRRLTLYLSSISGARYVGFPSRDQLGRMLRIAAERENIGPALTWCRSPAGDDGLGLRLASGIGSSVTWGARWLPHDPYFDAAPWIDDIQNRILAVPPEVRAETLYGLADLAQATGHWSRAQSLLGLLRTTAQQMGDWWSEAMSLWYDCYQFERIEGDFEKARPVYEEMLRALSREPLCQAWAEGWFGRALVAASETDRAIPLLDHALRVWNEHDIVWTNVGGTSYALQYLAQAYVARRDFDAAANYAERAAADFRRAGWHFAYALRLAALCALALGDADSFCRRFRASEPGPPIRSARMLQPRAEPNYLEEESSYHVRCVVFALARQRAALAPGIWPSVLCILAAAYLRCGKAGIAIRLYGAAQAQTTRAGPEALFRDVVEQGLAYFHAKALDDPALFEQWRAGERMSLDDVAVLLTGELEPSGRRTVDDRPRANPTEPPTDDRPRSAVEA